MEIDLRFIPTERELEFLREFRPDATWKLCEAGSPIIGMDDLICLGEHYMDDEGAWLLYYLYGMERAGRLSGQRFFGDHDWYREVAEYLVAYQGRRGE